MVKMPQTDSAFIVSFIATLGMLLAATVSVIVILRNSKDSGLRAGEDRKRMPCKARLRRLVRI